MVGIILLAAGASTRLGQPKQYLMYRGKTLLQSAFQTALNAEQGPVVVVLGAVPEAAFPPGSHVVQNPDWESGMSSSIRVGLDHLLTLEPEISGALFILCDQPFVHADLLKCLATTFYETGKDIVACSYANTLGAPVLFHRKLFPDLQTLKGHEGAKKLISRYPDSVATVPFVLAAVDIDTPQDYQHLQMLEKGTEE